MNYLSVTMISIPELEGIKVHPNSVISEIKVSYMLMDINIFKFKYYDDLV